MSYVTLGDLRTYIGVSDNLDDDTLLISQSAADQMVDAYCGRSFTAAGTAATTHVYAAHDAAWVAIDDASSVTLVETYNGSTWTAWDAADWQGEPLNGIQSGQQWPTTALRAVTTKTFPPTSAAWVRVTATWGWPAVPDVVQHAAMMQAARLFKRRDSVLGIAGGPDTGLIRVGRALDGDVAQLLGPYRRGLDGFGGLA